MKKILLILLLILVCLLVIYLSLTQMKYLIQSLMVVGLILDILGVLYLCAGGGVWQNAFDTCVGNLLEKIPVSGYDEKEKHWYAVKNPTSFGIILIISGFLVLLLAAILGFFVID